MNVFSEYILGGLKKKHFKNNSKAVILIKLKILVTIC